jgi:hypothetical protein
VSSTTSCMAQSCSARKCFCDFVCTRIRHALLTNASWPDADATSGSV